MSRLGDQQCRSFRAEDWHVRPCELKAAQRLVAEQHYAKGGSNTAVCVYGLYDRAFDSLCGIAWWLPPTRVCAESVNRPKWRRVLALSRLVVCDDVPLNGASYLLGGAIRSLRRERKWSSLVTYADESQQHTGAIYRASNWVYCGRTGPYPRWVDPASGRQVATLATKTRTKAQMLERGYMMTGRFYKHKFILHLDGTDYL